MDERRQTVARSSCQSPAAGVEIGELTPHTFGRSRIARAKCGLDFVGRASFDWVHRNLRLLRGLASGVELRGPVEGSRTARAVRRGTVVFKFQAISASSEYQIAVMFAAGRGPSSRIVTHWITLEIERYNLKRGSYRVHRESGRPRQRSILHGSAQLDAAAKPRRASRWRCTQSKLALRRIEPAFRAAMRERPTVWWC